MDRDSNDLVQHTWVYNFSLRCFGTVYLPALDRRVEADLLANEVQSCHLNMKSTVQRPSLHPSRRLSGTEKGSTGNMGRAANLEGRPRVVLMLLALQSQLDVQTLELCCCWIASLNADLNSAIFSAASPFVRTWLSSQSY